MNRYNAKPTDQIEGYLPKDMVDKLIYFGPGRDSTRLSHAVHEIFGLLTTTGSGMMGMSPEAAEVLGIQTEKPKRWDGDQRHATIQNAVGGVIRHVAESELETDAIVPAAVANIEQLALSKVVQFPAPQPAETVAIEAVAAVQ